MKSQKDIFEELYRDYLPMVNQMCLGFMQGDHEAAQDLTQETFIHAWNALQRFQGASSYKTWLYRITVNTCLKYMRDKKRQSAFPVEVIPDTQTETFTTAPYQELYQAIGQLSELDRLIMMLLLEELDYDTIAEIIGMRPGNLRVKIHRIKKKLKTLIRYG